MESGGTTNPDIRTIFRTPEYDEFYGSLSQKVQVKFDYVVGVIASVYNIPVKFVKHLEKTDLYEMRVSVGTNEYRTVLFAIDQENVIEAKNVILLNGFLKKDSKQYCKEIEKAKSILSKLEL